MFTEPYKLVNKNEKSAILITCEHASNRLPPSFSLPKRLINSHWALDVGISKVVDRVAEILDCTAIKSNYSRLIIDLNRHFHQETLIREKTSRTVPVLFNRNLSKKKIEERKNKIHKPYHDRIDSLVKELKKHHKQIILICLHSFTPIYFGKPRHVEIGMMYNEHKRLAKHIGEGLREFGYDVKYNEPYSAIKGEAYTAYTHGRHNDILWVEIETNNKLLRTKHGINKIAKDMAKVFKKTPLTYYK